jgi:hypothetical protein
MSQTFTLTGTSNVLSATYFPPIELNPKYQYGLGLVGFYTYNTIPNIHSGNNQFVYYVNKQKQTISVPEGAYEITELNNYLQKNVGKEKFSLRPNNNTLQCEIESTYEIDFTGDDSLGQILGFSSKRLQAKKVHYSDLPVEIIKVVNIRIECNVTGGAYHGDDVSHTLFEFDIDVETGYRLTKEPHNIIYLPILKNSIDNITLSIVDQDYRPVDFRNETITVRLELKKLYEK